MGGSLHAWTLILGAVLALCSLSQVRTTPPVCPILEMSRDRIGGSFEIHSSTHYVSSVRGFLYTYGDLSFTELFSSSRKLNQAASEGVPERSSDKHNVHVAHTPSENAVQYA